jgi:hypothetical protein
LKDLLSLNEDDKIVRVGGRLFAHLFRRTVPLRQLSDGYQSMVAVCADIMLNLGPAA